MKILITGGLGLLGGRLAHLLLKKGHEVFIGTRKSLKSIPEPLSESVPIQIDWSNFSTLKSASKGIDAVVHAAGLNAQSCTSNPSLALDVNGLYTASLLEAAKDKGVKRFIYLSTIHVYCSPLVGTIDESHPAKNLHPYATSKLAGEKNILYANQMKQIQGVVLRLANGSGYPIFPEIDCWHLLVNNLCRQAAENRELNLHSQENQERNFISINELCLGIEHFLRMPESFIDNVPFNLCSEQSNSIKDIAHLVASRSKLVLGHRPEIVYKKANKKIIYGKKLRIDSLKIKKTGLFINNNLDTEIDNTLMFCASNFA